MEKVNKRAVVLKTGREPKDVVYIFYTDAPREVLNKLSYLSRFDGDVYKFFVHSLTREGYYFDYVDERTNEDDIDRWLYAEAIVEIYDASLSKSEKIIEELLTQPEEEIYSAFNLFKLYDIFRKGCVADRTQDMYDCDRVTALKVAERVQHAFSKIDIFGEIEEECIYNATKELGLTEETEEKAV